MFACSLGAAVPLCLQIETFKPGLYFKLQEGTEHSKSAVAGLQIHVIRGRLDSDQAWYRLCCSVHPSHRSLDTLLLEPCALGLNSLRVKHPVCARLETLSPLLLGPSAAVPAPAAGQLLNTHRQTRHGRECASPFPLRACLRKSFQILLISSLPFLRTQK